MREALGSIPRYSTRASLFACCTWRAQQKDWLVSTCCSAAEGRHVFLSLSLLVPLVYALAENPEVYAEVRKEVLSLFDTAGTQLQIDARFKSKSPDVFGLSTL
jgi:hypothetical protein